MSCEGVGGDGAGDGRNKGGGGKDIRRGEGVRRKGSI